MRTAALLAMAAALDWEARIAREFQRSSTTPPAPRGPGGKTERRAKSKAAKQARKKQRGRK